MWGIISDTVTYSPYNIQMTHLHKVSLSSKLIDGIYATCFSSFCWIIFPFERIRHIVISLCWVNNLATFNHDNNWSMFEIICLLCNKQLVLKSDQLKIWLPRKLEADYNYNFMIGLPNQQQAYVFPVNSPMFFFKGEPARLFYCLS